MRSAGFPCRVAGCRRAFPVADQASMEALGAASVARSAHEITEHGYHHVRLSDEPSVPPYYRRRPTIGAPRRR